MWRRDNGVAAMIEYFDRGICSRLKMDENEWASLSSVERFTLIGGLPDGRKLKEAIMEQARECANDFSYAARNYFWITTKKKKEQLLTLWESQHLILDKYYELKAMGKAQKIAILKARQLGALAPETRVLTALMEWKRIDDLVVGEDLIATDEFPVEATRLLRTAKVLRKWRVKKEAFLLTMKDGSTITATADHPFLCKKRGSTANEWRTVRKVGTRKQAAPIVPGDAIRVIARPWEASLTYEDGWFSGFLDGEGSLRAKENGGIELTVSQVEGAALSRAIEYLDNCGFPYKVEVDARKGGESSKLGNKPVFKLVVHRMPEVFRLLGRTRPSRFMGRRLWEGKDFPSSGDESWAVVESVESIGIRDMVDIETTTGTFIAEGVVTHNCSTLIEAMIAWRAMFYPNTRAIVVSRNQKHSSYLFGYMLYIYDHMPWWLKPMQASRKEDYGLVFDNEDPALRSRFPGMNSKVMVQWANQYSGVGEGIAIDAAHISEFCGYMDTELEEIVNADLGNSMADEPEVFGFLEGTGEGAGRASHKMWRSWENRIDSGRWPKWYPLFLPSFFETTRVLPPPSGWHIQEPELVMRDRTKREWCRCDNKNCGKYKKGIVFGEPVAGSLCPDCRGGTLIPMLLTDEQCYWHQDNREAAEEQGEVAKKQWTSEQAVTAEEAFQVSGYVMFNDACREWVNSTVNEYPIKKGKIYRETGEIHGASNKEGRCYVDGCNVDHRHDETPFRVWEEPQAGRSYSIGVDVSEGIGQDYSVIFVNKIGMSSGEPDEQVALWRDNHTKPKELAFYCNVIGRWYNDALMAIEYNLYQTTGDDVIYIYQYPNIFRWKHKDSVNPMSNKWHWWTKSDSKSRLHQTAVDWLLSRSWAIRSSNFSEEITTYQKEDYESRSVGAEAGFHDDELLAGMIALYTAHELDCDEVGRVRVPSRVEFQKPARYRCYCDACHYGEKTDPDGKWPWVCDNPEREYRCPSCESIQLRAVSLEIPQENRMDYDSLIGMMTKRISVSGYGAGSEDY